MATIVTRAGKGSPLTHTEVDANFTNLNTDKVESSALATVATTGAYGDLSGLPTLGTAAATAATDYATAAQGVTADAALPKTGGAVTGNVTFGDGVKATFGTSADLQIFHDGTHSRIDNNQGDLFIQSDTIIRITNSAASETAAKFFVDGAVELYHNNAKKIGTTASGISVTGEARAVQNATSANLFVAEADMGTYNNRTLILRSPDTDSASEPFVFNTSNTLAFETDATERLRISNDGIQVTGNIGVTGTVDGRDIATNIPASLGTAGQVLSVNAGATAGEWADAGGGGGTVDFTASGAISNGDLVSINSDGTVSVTSGFGLVPTAFSPNSTEKNTPVYDTLNNKVVVCYRDTSDNYGKAVVGTVSGGSITFGTPVTFAATNAEDVHATFDSTNNKVVAIYRDRNNSDYGTSVVGTVSGTSISFGSATVFESGEAATPFIAFDSNAGKVVVSYRDGGNSNYGTAVVGTVSGTSISFGTPVVFLSALTQNPFPVFDSNSNKMVILYKGNAGDGKAVVGTVSGTSISFGSEGQFDGATIEQTAGAFDSTNNKIVVVYKNSSNIPKAGIGTVSGTSISFNTAVTISDDTVNFPKAAYDVTGGVVGVVFRSTSNGSYPTYVPLTVSGASLSVGDQLLLGEFSSIGNDLAYDPDEGVFVHVASNSNATDGIGQVYNANSNLTNWIGVSTSAITDAASGTITIVSGANESQSGLTVGSKYYISDGGALSATENVGKEIGRALSATNLLITQGSVS